MISQEILKIKEMFIMKKLNKKVLSVLATLSLMGTLTVVAGAKEKIDILKIGTPAAHDESFKVTAHPMNLSFELDLEKVFEHGKLKDKNVELDEKNIIPLYIKFVKALKNSFKSLKIKMREQNVKNSIIMQMLNPKFDEYKKIYINVEDLEREPTKEDYDKIDRLSENVKEQLKNVMKNKISNKISKNDYYNAIKEFSKEYNKIKKSIAVSEEKKALEDRFKKIWKYDGKRRAEVEKIIGCIEVKGEITDLFERI